MNKESYFNELGIVLGRSGFTPLPEQDGFLPVEYEGWPLCRVDAEGSVLYRQDDVNTLERESACRRVTNLAAIVLEYMTGSCTPLRCPGHRQHRLSGNHRCQPLQREGQTQHRDHSWEADRT